MKDDSPFEALRPQPLEWQQFEIEVAQYIEDSVADLALGVIPCNSKVRRKPKYFSRDRESEITFDISIEIFAAAGDESPTLKWVWECKDFPTRTVSVNEVEVFADQIRQVGAHKGTIVTRKGFQPGAISLATSRGIGLMVLRKEKVFHIAFSQDAGILGEVQLPATYCLFTFGEIIEGAYLDDLLHFEFDRLVLT